MQIHNDNDLAANARHAPKWSLLRSTLRLRRERDGRTEGSREQTLPLITSALNQRQWATYSTFVTGRINIPCNYTCAFKDSCAEFIAWRWRSLKALLGPSLRSSSFSVRAASQLQTLFFFCLWNLKKNMMYPWLLPIWSSVAAKALACCFGKPASNSGISDERRRPFISLTALVWVCLCSSETFTRPSF